MEFSLIVCTLGRDNEIKELFISLYNQTFKDFEVILIDQNSNGILDEIVEEFSTKLNLKHIRSNKKGLSKARNLGIKYARGNYIAFPDDDCLYEEQTLEKIFETFKSTDYDFLTCNTKEKDSENALLKFPSSQKVMKGNYYKVYAVSFTLFFKKDVVFSIGNFDETLGVGSGTIFGAGEETDYLIRTIKNGYKGLYLPDMYVYHPAKEVIYNKETFNRALLYGGGTGKVAKKHYNFYRVLRTLIGPLILSIINVKEIKKSKFFFLNFIGRVRGYFKG